MKPNVLFILTDDQRFDMLGRVTDGLKTPNMDTLADSGVLFEQAHIQGGTVPAICMPSRGMIFSGRHLFHLSENGLFIPPEDKTIPELFREAGYDTCGIGKWHNGRESYARSFTCGGTIFFGGMWDHWNVPVYDFDPAGNYSGRLPRCQDFMHSNEVTFLDGDFMKSGTHSSELFSNTAIEFLRNHDKSRNFFLSLCYLAPHDPRTTPPEYKEMYPFDRIALPPNFLVQYPFENGSSQIRDELLATSPRSPDEIRRHIRDYYAITTHLDDQIGRVIRCLKENGLYENTLIILAGDNGLAVGEHGLMGKQNLHEHSIRIPLILSGPGIVRNKGCRKPVFLYDIMPTLCELFGLPLPPGADGESFAPELKNTSEIRTEPRQMYFAYSNCQRGLKRGEFKLIEYVVGGRNTVTQLFHLKDDPFEIRNLADLPEYRVILKEMKKELFSASEHFEDGKTESGKTFWSAIPQPTEF